MRISTFRDYSYTGFVIKEARNDKRKQMTQEELEKINAINRFLDVNRVIKSCQIVEFQAIVEYLEHSIIDVTKVQIKLDNFHFGDVEVYPTDRIDITLLHTGFSEPFNEYNLDNQTLVIKGTASPAKGGENYTVKITPVR